METNTNTNQEPMFCDGCEDFTSEYVIEEGLILCRMCRS